MMTRLIFLALLPTTLCGCAGYKLTPIPPSVAANAHAEGSTPPREGYIFYAPRAYLLGTLRSGSANSRATANGRTATPPPGFAEDPAAPKTSDDRAQPGPASSAGASAATLYSYDFQVIYLPDYGRPFRFTSYEFLAKSELNISFKDGWMFTGAESSVDSTVALGHVVELAKAAAGLLLSDSQDTPPDSMILYELTHEGGRPKLRQVDIDKLIEHKTGQ